LVGAERPNGHAGSAFAVTPGTPVGVGVELVVGVVVGVVVVAAGDAVAADVTTGAATGETEYVSGLLDVADDGAALAIVVGVAGVVGWAAFTGVCTTCLVVTVCLVTVPPLSATTSPSTPADTRVTAADAARTNFSRELTPWPKCCCTSHIPPRAQPRI
jgi:hypothetical protein